MKDSNVLILGLTFKENCPDIRNTKVIDVINEFQSYGAHLDVYDPWVDKAEAQKEYGINLLDTPPTETYDAIVLCVAHDEFQTRGVEWIHSLGKKQTILYDVKNILPTQAVDGRL